MQIFALVGSDFTPGATPRKLCWRDFGWQTVEEHQNVLLPSSRQAGVWGMRSAFLNRDLI